MAKYLDLSQSPRPRTRRGAQTVRLTLLILMSVSFGAPDVRADPWLDRVERSLRRIDSAAKYTEPAGAGSKLATKTHNACIRQGDTNACEKLIWRSPELLPVRDWAVGTAHIKRGEMREQNGDVSGALEDYRDALGYHQFPNLNARIKRLEKRKQLSAQRAAEKKGAQDEKQARNADVKSALGDNPIPQPEHSSVPKAGELEGIEPRHPVVVVAGWAATIADKKNLPPAGVAPVAGNPSPPTLSQSKPSGAPTQGATIAAPTAPVPDVRAYEPQNSDPAARFVPGRRALKNVIAAQADAPRGLNDPSPLPIDGSSLSQEYRQLPTRTTPSEPGELQSNVNDQVVRSLARVRDKTNEVLTTSALPDRSRPQHNAQQRSFMSLTIMALLTLMLFSTVAVTRGWRPTLPFVLPRAERKPLLSVDDLERLIKSRAAELVSTEGAATLQRHPKIGPVARAHLPKGFSGAAPSAEPAPHRSNKEVPVNSERLKQEEAKAAAKTGAGMGQPPGPTTLAHGTVADSSSSKTSLDDVLFVSPPNVQQPAVNPNLDGLDTSLLRRVSYGAASLVVVGSGTEKTCTDEIVAKVDAARRPELLGRRACWDAAQSSAKGVLNPFAVGINASDDPLSVRQQFNAAFEFHSSIFESIFGARFVYDQKVTLRYLVMLLQAMPNSSLKTLYDLLEAPRSLEPLRDALIEIDNVSARLFFTTEFSSEEFSQKANHMRTRLADVVASDLVDHLCCGTPAPGAINAISDLFTDGRWVLLPLASDSTSPQQRRVLVRSLVSVLALHNSGRAPSNTKEICSSVYLPNAAEQIGGSRTDAEFLLNQVKRAGYNVL